MRLCFIEVVGGQSVGRGGRRGNHSLLSLSEWLLRCVVERKEVSSRLMRD